MAGRLTQEVVEVIVSPPLPTGRLTSYVLEVIVTTTNPAVVVEQLPIEVLATYNSTIILEQQCIEVLRTVAAINPVEHTLVFTQEATGYVEDTSEIFEDSVTHTLTFDQTIGRQVTYNRAINQTLILTQQAVTPYPVSHTLTFNQIVTGQASRIHIASISHTLIFEQRIKRGVVPFIDQDLEFTQTITGSRIYNRTVSQTLEFTQKVVNNPVIKQTLVFNQSIHARMIYNRTITQSLVFKDYKRKILPIHKRVIEVPNVIGVLKPRKCLVLLSVPDQTVVLPCPELGDKRSNSISVNLQRSLNGTPYTYVKTGELVKISYSFILHKRKMIELRTFLINNLASLITMQNWKAETWLCYLLKDPADWSNAGAYRDCDEKVEIDLEFEGVRIS